MNVRSIIKRFLPEGFLDYWRYLHFNGNKKIYKGKTYNDYYEYSKLHFDSALSCRVKNRDLIYSWYRYHVRPDEYYLYQFYKLDKKTRESYLPQWEKNKMVCGYYGKEYIRLNEQLQDKWLFYQLMRSYYLRDVIYIKNESDLFLFEQFCKQHPKFFSKPIKGHCGEGIRIIEVKNEKSIKKVFNELISNGGQVIEEPVVQSAVLSAFNPTSLNTIRIYSFKHDGNVTIMWPVLRMGRLGCIVDNGGSGGLFASIDLDTGKIVTDGYDELGHIYETHPDSGIRFKGFQMPNWSNFIQFVKDAHLSLSPEHVYVAFDIGLSTKGWVIIEGNWGDIILPQVTMQKGFKREFMQLLRG